MLQTSKAPPLHAPSPADEAETELLDPLLRLAGEVRESRALIVGEDCANLLCALIQRGCLAATALRTGERSDPRNYDLVVVPDAEIAGTADSVCRLARRSLIPLGRLIVGVRDGRTAVALASRLRLNGFTALRFAHVSDLVLLRADLRRTA